MAVKSIGTYDFPSRSRQELYGDDQLVHLWFQEDMSTGRWIGFALVWVALAIFTFESIRHRRRQLRVAAEAVAV